MIREITETVVDAITAATADLGSWVLVTPLHEGAPQPTANRLHVYLHAVEEHGHMRNQPVVRTPEGYKRAPLALRLHYVMSYFGNDHLEAQARLDRVVQVFHTTPILGPEVFRPALVGHVERLTVRMRSLGTEERSQIWTALGRPMRLSLYYDVDVAPIDTLEREGQGIIESRDVRYGLVPA